MLASNKKLYLHIGVLAVLLMICSLVYSRRSQTFTKPSLDTANFINPYTLRDWVPGDVYTSILSHTQYYLAKYDMPGTTLTITSTPRFDSSGELFFNFETDKSSSTHTIIITTTDYGGSVTSTSVAIDGENQTYSTVTRLYGTTFNKFDTLTSYGLSGIQVYGIQRTLSRYFTGNTSFELVPNNVTQSATDNTSSTTFGFYADGRLYQAQNTSTGITDIHLVVSDNNGKQVFDSGIVDINI